MASVALTLHHLAELDLDIAHLLHLLLVLRVFSDCVLGAGEGLLFIGSADVDTDVDVPGVVSLLVALPCIHCPGRVMHLIPLFVPLPSTYSRNCFWYLTKT